MKRSEVLSYYKEYSMQLESAYTKIKNLYSKNYVDELCTMRGYVGEDQRALIAELEIGCCDIVDMSIFGDWGTELGLVSKSGRFLLSNRFIVPIRDIQGNLVSLVGYFNDYKKYITLPTKFFSKEVLFFNIDHAYDLSWTKFGGTVFLVEGIFDCLSLRSIGLPVIATMGSSVGVAKSEQLKLFSKVIGITDADEVGRVALNRHDKKRGWRVPSNTTMLRIQGGTIAFGGVEFKVKDVDDLVSWYDKESIVDLLLSYRDSREEIEDLIL